MRLSNLFPLYITVSPQCWFGHNYMRWNAYDRDGVLKPYGLCNTCGKEKFWAEKAVWRDTNLEQFSRNSTGSQMHLKGSQMDQIWQMTDTTNNGLPVVVVADDLLDFVKESGLETINLKGIEMEEFIDLLDDWIFEGTN